MSKRLDWLTENQWTSGAHARDKDGREVSPNSLEAKRFDLFGALRVSYYDDDDFWQAVKQLKKAFEIIFKEKVMSLERHPDREYYHSQGKLVYPLTLSAMNDTLVFSDVKRLLFYID